MQWYYVHAVDQLVGLTAIEIAFNDDPKVGLSISHHPFHVRSNAWLCSAYKKHWLKARANSPKAQTKSFICRNLQIRSVKEGRKFTQGKDFHKSWLANESSNWKNYFQSTHFCSSLKHQLGNRGNFQVRLIWYKITGLSKSNSLEPPFLHKRSVNKKIAKRKALELFKTLKKHNDCVEVFQTGLVFCLTGRQVTTTWIV